MPQTRSSNKSQTHHEPTAKSDLEEESPNEAGLKRKQPSQEDKKLQEDTSGESTSEEVPQEPPAKAKKQDGNSQPAGLDQGKLDKLLKVHGKIPLSDSGLSEPQKSTAATVLAHILNAMLTSARISHVLAAKSVRRLIEANYHDLETLAKNTWEERTQVLTEGGYTRYREKTATALGELAELISSKYDGDLNKLREVAGDDPQRIRELVKEVKGLGEVGVNIFQDTVQILWPSMAPYIDPRSLDTAEGLGIGRDVDALWQGVGKDASRMAMLCQALTTLRLEKREGEFED